MEEILAIAVENQNGIEEREFFDLSKDEGSNLSQENHMDTDRLNGKNHEIYFEKNWENKKEISVFHKNIVNICLVVAAGFGSFLCFLCSFLLFQSSYRESLIMIGVAAMIVVSAVLMILYNIRKAPKVEIDDLEKKGEEEIHYIDFFGQNEFQH